MGLPFQNNVTTSCGDKIDPRRAAVGSPVSEEDFLSVLGQIKPHQLDSDLISTDEEGDVWLCPAVTTPASNQRPPTLYFALYCCAQNKAPPLKYRPQQRSDIGGHSLLKPDPFIQRSHGAGVKYVSTATIFSGAP